MMKSVTLSFRKLSLLALMLIATTSLFAQSSGFSGAMSVSSLESSLKQKQRLPFVAIKTNLLYDATTTMNLGLEFRLGKRTTLDVPVNYNPWEFHEGKKFKHTLVQPEIRHWFNESFNGHFIGFHVGYSAFNIAGIDIPLNVFPGLKENRYEGNLGAVGFSYGFQKMLSKKLSFEGTVGLGYAYIDYEKNACGNCGEFIDRGYKHYFGPTKLGLSLVYIIK